MHMQQPDFFAPEDLNEIRELGERRKALLHKLEEVNERTKQLQNQTNRFPLTAGGELCLGVSTTGTVCLFNDDGISRQALRGASITPIDPYLLAQAFYKVKQQLEGRNNGTTKEV